MKEIFEMMKVPDKEKEDEIRVQLGIPLKIADRETTCPVTKACNSYESLEIEVQAIKDDLERIMIRAKDIFRKSSIQESLDFGSDMEPEEIWSTLSGMVDERLFIKSFNSLDEIKRREVAEHVLTRCNIFSGRASIFSSRYNSESGFIE